MDRGKTTTAFGSQEWLIRAISGETVTPKGVSDGDVRVNVFVVNWYVSESLPARNCRKRNKLTLDTKSTRSPAEVRPYCANSAGEETPK